MDKDMVTMIYKSLYILILIIFNEIIDYLITYFPENQSLSHVLSTITL